MITLEGVQRRQRIKGKDWSVINFKVWKHMSLWMKEKNVSPRAVLIEGCRMLGYNPETADAPDTDATTQKPVNNDDFPRI